jgi:hypothetical protein
MLKVGLLTSWEERCGIAEYAIGIWWVACQV